MANMLELRPYDFIIKKLDSGKEVVQLKSAVAFDESFLAECREKGVRDEMIKVEVEHEEKEDGQMSL